MALKSSQDRRSNEEIEELLEELAKLMDRTKILYEQYFMGIQKLPPQQLHKNIDRLIIELTREHIRNTALRYRLTTLKQKYGSYNTYWRRILREIEQGRYVRDIAKAGRRALRKGEELPPELVQAMPKRMRDRILRDREMVARKAERDASREQGIAAESASKPRPSNVHAFDDSALDGDLDLDAMFDAITAPSPGTLSAPQKAEAASPPSPARSVSAPPPRPPAARPKPPSTPPPRPAARPAAPSSASAGAKPPPGMSEGQARQLYQQFVNAKRQVGESTDNLSYDKLMKSLNQQAPGIMSKHQASGVAFGVAIKGDKVILKAKPKK